MALVPPEDFGKNAAKKEAEDPETKKLEDMSKKELVELATQKNVYQLGMTKERLIEAING